MNTYHFQISDMNCSSCISKIEGRLKGEEGIIESSINFATGKAKVVVEGKDPTTAVIAKIVTELGYPTISIQDGETVEEKKEGNTWLYIRTFGSLLLALPLMLPMIGDVFGKPWGIPIYLQLILATLIQFGAGYSFYIATFRGLKALSANMDTLVALGTSAAYFYSLFAVIFGFSDFLYFETSAVLIALILLGRFFEHRSKQRAQGG